MAKDKKARNLGSEKHLNMKEKIIGFFREGERCCQQIEKQKKRFC